jgi:hypothetical protein
MPAKFNFFKTPASVRLISSRTVSTSTGISGCYQPHRQTAMPGQKSRYETFLVAADAAIFEKEGMFPMAESWDEVPLKDGPKLDMKIKCGSSPLISGRNPPQSRGKSLTLSLIDVKFRRLRPTFLCDIPPFAWRHNYISNNAIFNIGPPALYSKK